MKHFTLFISFVLATMLSVAQTTVTITDDDLNGSATWTSDKTYLLDGFVFLEEGTLTIEAGTVIKGKAVPTSGDLASALIITTGGKIMAEGTADNPIIFTAEEDDLSDATDLAVTDRGLWGGLILLGKGQLGFNTETAQIEGIESTEARANYGGNDDTHNSGTLKYISIRHGGAELAPGDEINGLTMGGVGSETVIEHVEVIANDDDGFEWFGGTVSCKWLVSAFNKDDAFDYDYGWRGNGQFWFVIQGTDKADNGGEHDGAKDDDKTPYSKPTIYNATYIGSGVGATGGDLKNSTALHFRDNAAGMYANSIFTDFTNDALEVEDLASGVDSRGQMETGELVLKNNIWYGFGAGSSWDDVLRATDGGDLSWLKTHLSDNTNTIDADPMLRGISRTTDGGLDPRPMLGSPALSGSADLPDNDFFSYAPYKGAFGNTNWATSWTAVDAYGLFGDLPAGSAETVIVTDGDLNGSATWTSDKTYLLDGFVFLEEGTLTIQAGTVIKGKAVPTSGDLASALIITTGGKIMAQGTADNPIIFTAEEDDLSDATDLAVTDRGLWGGVILLGNGQLGFNTETAQIEGIESTEPRAKYGGNDDTHNSGTLKYISIRHGGAELAPGDEINGLTMGGVGSETVIEHVEVIANDDDGFEWFGGTVSCKWLVSAFNKDDAFDYDYGWRGNGQFWFVIQGTDKADNGGEHDGAKDDDKTPYSKPTIYNATYIGSGVGATGGDLKNSTALHFRDNAAGMYANSIFTDFANDALEVEDLSAGVDSRGQMEAGELVLKNNIWYGFGAGSSWDDVLRATDGGDLSWLKTHLSDNTNTIDADPMLRGISRTTDGGLDPRPMLGSPALSGSADLPDNDFFSYAPYKGAFGNTNWATSWTAVDAYGLFGDLPAGSAETVIVTDGDLNGSATWTSDKTYLLDGFVFLEEGTLTIQAGTVIKGKAVPTSGDLASALIITTGGKIMAEGTADNPIIFTAEEDDLEDGTDLAVTDRGLWGGVILLGNGQLGFNTETAQIEGIESTEPRAKYGGNDDTHNSGTLKYISIRHGGAELAPGDEINGLTMGGVGSETVIEHVEVIANDDDGFEWFGGTVSCKWLVSAFNKDDAFDYDYGWRGNGQFWFVIQGTDKADNGGEHDGAKDDDKTPYSKPTIYNATYIGSGVGATGGDLKNSTALHFRDNAAGMYANSIFTDFTNDALEVEDLASGVDSRGQMETGELVLKNNIWYGFGAGSSWDDVLRATDGGDLSWLKTHLSDNTNTIDVDPQISGISRTANAGLDPRPQVGSVAWTDPVADYPSDDFFTTVTYKGAFGEQNWGKSWTALDAYGFFGSLYTSSDVINIVEGVELMQNYPNPVSYNTTIQYSIPDAANVALSIYDLTGKKVRTVVDEYQRKGTYKVTVGGLDSGIYFYQVVAGDAKLTKKMIVR